MAGPWKKKASSSENKRGRKAKRTIGDPNKKDLSPEEEKKLKQYYADLKTKRRAERRKWYKEDGMEVRTRILHASLYIEETVDDLVVDLLGITEEGRKEMRLPFERKIWLLFAMDFVSKEERKLLDAFRTIRNKFIHEKRTNSYSTCLDKRDDLKKVVLALVDEEIAKKPFTVTGTEEGFLELGTSILTDRVPQICDNVKRKAVERFRKRVGGELFEAVYTRTKHDMESAEGPFPTAEKRIDGDIRIRYSKDEVKQVIRDLFADVSRVFQRAAKEERDNYFKRGLKRSGPIVDLPPPPRSSRGQ